MAYRLILNTKLRRDELKQLRWADVLLNAPMPCIQLRAETTKAKRADALPLRGDITALLQERRGTAGDDESVARTLPSMESHKRYLGWAGIEYRDDRGRQADFHSLRHTYGSMLAKAGIAPRVAMSLMRHTDLRLTMNVYTDPRIFDLAGAVELLPSLNSEKAHPKVPIPNGTLNSCGEKFDSEFVSSSSALSGIVRQSSAEMSHLALMSINPYGGNDRQQKTPPAGWGKMSGRRDSNPQQLAWKASALPLSYARIAAVVL